jgi:hypothetical protein
MKMKIRFIAVPFACLLFAVSACSSLPPAAPSPAATDTPIILTRPDASEAKRPLTASCTLLTQQDIAGFASGETDQPVYNASAVDHVIFSPDNVSANESACVYLAFHNPSSLKGTSYQITYWVDQPNQATASQWAQVWTDARAKAAQVVSGVGDDAFYDNGRLTFKKGSVYVTIEVLSTRLSTDTPEGVNQQIEMEKTLALEALSRM